MTTIGRHVSRLSGYAPALPTPFDDHGHIDGAAFEQICDHQIQEGATALVVCGTTGEAPTLSPQNTVRSFASRSARHAVGYP
jgi:4-hydroxy-tetrahydrodipicolinate synthase